MKAYWGSFIRGNVYNIFQPFGASSSTINLHKPQHHPSPSISCYLSFSQIIHTTKLTISCLPPPNNTKGEISEQLPYTPQSNHLS